MSKETYPVLKIGNFPEVQMDENTMLKLRAEDYTMVGDRIQKKADSLIEVVGQKDGSIRLTELHEKSSPITTVQNPEKASNIISAILKTENAKLFLNRNGREILLKEEAGELKKKSPVICKG